MRIGITGYLIAQTVLQSAAVVLIFLCIFLLEEVGGQISRALEAGLELTRIPYMMALIAPPIFGYALPLSLLIGMFRVFLRLRENGELVSITNTGLRPGYFLALAVWLGVTGIMVSLFLSGFVEPLSRYAHRTELFYAQKEAVQKGIKRGDVRNLNGYVAAAPNGRDERDVGVFVVDTNPKTFQRLISADRVVVEETATDGTYTANLENMRILFLGREAVGRSSPTGKEDNLLRKQREMPTAISAPSFARTLNVGAFASLPPRHFRDDQLTLNELLPWSTVAGQSTPKQILRGTGIVVQSMLCLIATLSALLAVCLTRSTASMVVLPAFAGGLVAIDFAFGALARFLSQAGWQPLFPSLVGQTVLVGITGVMAYRLTMGGAFLKPSRSAD